jgi:hypothetical protein
MAEYLSIGPIDPGTAMWLRDAVQHDTLPSIEKLDDPKYFPYRWGHAFWAYVGGRWGDQTIRQMLQVAARAGDVDVAIQKVLGISTTDLSNDWQAAIRRAYEPVFASAAPPGEVGRPLIKGAESGGDLNVGPALSPDGRWMAFLSSRSFMSIDLYLADAATGRIARRLTNTATNPHFSSLQFIYSAGAWDRTSRQLAVATVTDGRPALAIFDVETGRTIRELPIPALDEIFNPTWAPDGRAVAFTGMSQGLMDLYACDPADGTLRRLTNDAYAELQPAWSPDGHRIAFATDRFSTDLPSLAPGAYRLAVLDVDSGAVDPLPVFPNAASLNPQWSHDGTQLYFLANPHGIPNLFRLAYPAGDVVRLTNVSTGLSGITASSPAMSVSSGTGAVSFSVYENGAYSIYLVHAADQKAVALSAAPDAAFLPPADRQPSDVAALLTSPTVGLPEPALYPTSDYKPKLSLEAVGQPTIAVGASRLGAAFGGGVSLSFGDMLGNHTLATAVQFSSLSGSFSLKDVAVQAGYFNNAHRWSRGVVAGQLPYLSGAILTTLGRTPEGELIEIDQTTISRQTERSALGMVAYPFTRTRRIEFAGGVTQVSFDATVQTTVFSIETGRILLDETIESSPAESVTLATSAAAFVSDTSVFGATSPVQGERYRIEAAPSIGTITFTSLLGDYRRYLMPVPFYTIAVRAMHYGRYGSGGEDVRLSPLYLGYPTLVRGYDANSFEASECIPDATSDCPAFDRLMGTRLVAGNVELRFPLLRPFGVSRRMYGPLPVEVALFADGGVAWNKGEAPSLFGGARSGVSSVGLTFRVNLMGMFVGQFDIVRPLQRPRQGWVFQFNLAQGF